MNLSVQTPLIARQECCALGPAIGTGSDIVLTVPIRTESLTRELRKDPFTTLPKLPHLLVKAKGPQGHNSIARRGRPGVDWERATDRAAHLRVILVMVRERVYVSLPPMHSAAGQSNGHQEGDRAAAVVQWLLHGGRVAERRLERKSFSPGLPLGIATLTRRTGAARGDGRLTTSGMAV